MLRLHVVSSWAWLAITLQPQLVISSSITGWMQEMLERVNQERANNGGLDPLCYNEKVILAAQVHNQDMVDNNMFSHTGTDGSGPSDRLTNQGYIWNAVAENVAFGQSSVASVMDAWMDSTGHKANILSTSVVHFGAAWDAGTNKWTQVFGNSNSEGCLSTPPGPTPSGPTPTGGGGNDPGAQDDPHLFTWEGTMYDYHGQCDLIYTTCPKFDNSKGFHLHIRTQFVEPMMWSTISSMAVKIGDDVFEVHDNDNLLNEKENGNYYLNGESNVELTDATNLAGHALTKRVDKSRTFYNIDLGDNVSLEIKVRTYSHKKTNVGFKIFGVHDHRANGGKLFEDCVGLSSTWEHPEGEEILVGRSGTNYAKHEAVDFGPEWQVDLSKNDPLLFFEKDISRQLPHQECLESSFQAKDQRRLKKLVDTDGGALARQAEEACSNLKGRDDVFDACFFDVLVTGDVTYAEEHEEW